MNYWHSFSCLWLIWTAPAWSAPPEQENGKSEKSGADLPKQLTPGHFETLKANSPFTRSLNLSDSLILTGLATVDGKKVATLMNKHTKETYVVSEEPNPQGWKMVDVAGTENLETVAAKISVTGGEVVTVRYDEWSLKPGEAKPAGGGGGEIKPGGERHRGPGDGRPPMFGGPPPEMRDRMMALSDEKRKKLFEQMMKLRTEQPNLSWEERGQLFQKTLEKLEKSE